MSPPLRLLWLEGSCPNPPTGGHRLRVHHLLEEVAKRHRVSLVCEAGEAGDDIGPLAARCEQLRTVPVGSFGLRGRARQALGALGGPPGRPAFYVPANIEGYRQAAGELSARGAFDVAIGGLDVAPAVLTASARASILDSDNVEDDLYRQLWQAESWGLRKLAALRDWRAVRHYERRWVPRPDAVTVCSARDRARMRDWGRTLPPIHVVPNGVDLEAEPFSAGPRNQDMLIMVGIMSWPPNVEGARFLVGHVMPRIWTVRPAARLWLIGKDPSRRVRSLAGEQVIVTGVVPDVLPFRRRAALELVPLFAGGGTRLKVLQAMAAGTPVVSTEIGAEGLELRPGVEIEIANGAPEMTQAILALLSERSRASALASAARRRVEADFGWQAIGARLADLIEALARR